MYYVYHLIDPRDNKVFYVGKGKGSRINYHEREAAKGIFSDKCNTIRKIIGDSLKVRKVFVMEFVGEEDAYNFEMLEIKRIGLHNLTNCKQGFVPPIRSRNKQREDIFTIKLFMTLMRKTNFLKLQPIIGLCGISVNVPDKLVQIIVNKFISVCSRQGSSWVVGQMLPFYRLSSDYINLRQGD